MGQVDLCVRQTGRFERLYAVKRLHPHLREDEAMRSMFLDEARVAGMVRHANVVAVLDVGEDADGPFLVMDYVEGVSLSRLIRAQAQAGTLLPIPVCAQIMAQIARGLHAAHELTGSDGAPINLVHRDVSPQNILVGRDGTVRVTDFGIAKALGRSTHTSTGVLKGKLGYMSPEQLRFEPLDRRSDLFALGVILFELTLLRRLFRGDEASEVARQIIHEVPPDLGEARPDAPPALVELAFELLAKNREDRPATAQIVADRLDELVTAYGEVVDVGAHLELCFGAELDAEHERIRSLMEGGGEASQSAAALVPPTVADSPTTRAWWRTAALAVGAAAVIGAAGAALALRSSSTLQPSTPPLSSSPSELAEAEASASVTLELDSRPSDAQIIVNDAVIGRTPLSWTLPRGESSVVVTVTSEGFLPAEHIVVPDRDQSVLLALTPAPPQDPATEAADPASDPEAAAERSRASRTRRRRSKPEPAPSEPTKPRFRKFD